MTTGRKIMTARAGTICRQISLKAVALRQVRTLEHEKGQLKLELKRLTKERGALLTTTALKERNPPRD